MAGAELLVDEAGRLACVPSTSPGRARLVPVVPYIPAMLLSPSPAPTTGEDWVHECKLDGWRACVAISAGRVRVWSRRGWELSAQLPDLAVLGRLDRDVVLDGELVAFARDGRADFELLFARLNSSGRNRPRMPRVVLCVFDLLLAGDRDLCDQPWSVRRAALEQLDLAERSKQAARLVPYSADGDAMWQASAEVGGEGVCSKRVTSVYVPGRRVTFWRKTKLSTSPPCRWSDGGPTHLLDRAV
jgi:bifunctional non-homologous end joining protein LigD